MQQILLARKETLQTAKKRFIIHLGILIEPSLALIWNWNTKKKHHSCSRKPLWKVSPELKVPAHSSLLEFSCYGGTLYSFAVAELKQYSVQNPTDMLRINRELGIVLIRANWNWGDVSVQSNPHSGFLTGARVTENHTWRVNRYEMSGKLL